MASTTGPSHEREQAAALATATARTDAGNDAAITQLQTDLDAAEATIAAQATSIANINTWINATATKLNALGAKLNLDAGVTDVNYAVDYDTNAQA